MINLSTTKLFILIAIIFVLLIIFLVGPTNPFSFGEAYFRPRTNPSPTAVEPINIVLPEDAQPTEVKIDR